MTTRKRIIFFSQPPGNAADTIHAAITFEVDPLDYCYPHHRLEVLPAMTYAKRRSSGRRIALVLFEGSAIGEKGSSWRLGRRVPRCLGETRPRRTE
ncbi:hypothetical protein N7527_005753 [Penicillium freii]|nr:hypothetical protein N7527_005753 [Penicillium freii]